MSRESIIKSATQWMVNLANDNSHGYDQAHRWGPDYDCSSAVITAWQQAGVAVKSGGAYNTSTMLSVFKNYGFNVVTSSVNLSTGSGLQYGDVLLNAGEHTAMSLGNGTIVHASINENGGITGGQTGDQTGKEICIRSYYNHPWNYVLRYGTGSTSNNITYQVYDNVKKAFLPNVTNTSDYAGIFGDAISAIYASVSTGDIYYRAHIKGGGWYSQVVNRTDYAGDKSNPIDAIMMKTTSGTVHYRVHLKSKNTWLPYVTGYSTSDSDNGYAGILGSEIDAVEAYIS